jgi:hypothetical protein
VSGAADRASDLLDALEILSRQRNAEPEAYRTVHAAAADAIGALHADLLDPRGGDFESTAKQHADLARRLRGLPRPTTGQPAGPTAGPPGRGGAVDPLVALLGRARGRGTSLDSLLGDVATGVAPQVERAVREGLKDLFGRLGRTDGADDADADEGQEGTATGTEDDGAVQEPGRGETSHGDEIWDEPAP